MRPGAGLGGRATPAARLADLDPAERRAERRRRDGRIPDGHPLRHGRPARRCRTSRGVDDLRRRLAEVIAARRRRCTPTCVVLTGLRLGAEALAGRGRGRTPGCHWVAVLPWPEPQEHMPGRPTASGSRPCGPRPRPRWCWRRRCPPRRADRAKALGRRDAWLAVDRRPRRSWSGTATTPTAAACTRPGRADRRRRPHRPLVSPGQRPSTATRQSGAGDLAAGSAVSRGSVTVTPSMVARTAAAMRLDIGDDHQHRGPGRRWRRSRSCARTVGGVMAMPPRRGRRPIIRLGHARSVTGTDGLPPLEGSVGGCLAFHEPGHVAMLGRGGAPVGSRCACGVDTGGTFTDVVAADGDDRQGAVHAGRPGPGGAGGASAAARRAGAAGRRAGPRHHGGHQRPARAPGRRRRAGHHRGLRRRHRDRPPGPPVALRPLGRPAGAARGPRPAARGATGAWRPTAPSSSRSTRSTWRRSTSTRPRRSPSACCTRTSTPATSSRWPPCSRAAGLDVTCSHEVSPEFREYERTVTTVVNAYLRPRVPRLPARPRPARPTRCW